VSTVGAATLTHLIEVESARRGLTKDEMVICLAKAMEMAYARRGDHVQVETSENTESGELTMTVRKMSLQNGVTVEHSVRTPLIPNHEDLARAVEIFREDLRRINPWMLTLARVLAVNPDHYLIECTDPQFDKQVAVLPKQLSGDTPLKKLQEIYVVAQPWRAEKISGTEAWTQIQAPLIASRVASQLFVQLLKKYCDMDVVAAVMSGGVMLVTPPGVDIKLLIAAQSQVLNLLKTATGATRIFVAPMGKNPDPLWRLINTVCRVTGLKYPSQFRISQPQNADKPDWIVFVGKENLAKFIGHHGQNLYFIMYLSGMQFQCRERKVSYKARTEIKPGAQASVAQVQNAA
jgi:hypothetical protein